MSLDTLERVDIDWMAGGSVTMILYHGSNVIVESPRLVLQPHFLDFGAGFYTTLNREQALSFAEKVYRRREDGKPSVSVYEFDEDSAFAACSLLRFDAADEAWLDFVYENRTGTYRGAQYELIYGAVANDDVFQTFTLYQTGILSKAQTIDSLKIKQLFNQLVFTSERALGYLKFTGTVGVEV
jgi:hypothetical protein